MKSLILYFSIYFLLYSVFFNHLLVKLLTPNSLLKLKGNKLRSDMGLSTEKKQKNLKKHRQAIS